MAMEMKLLRLNDGNETWSLDKGGGPETAEINYFAMFCSKSEAMSAVWEQAPKTYGTLPLQEVRFDGYDSDGNIKIAAVYADDDDSDSDDDDDADEEAEMSFDCGCGTMHVTHTNSQTCVYARSNDLKSEWESVTAIGWNGKAGQDCQIDGVEVETAQMRETYTKWIASANLTTAYRRRIAAAVGKVNSSSFKGWNAGEAKFLGCSFSRSETGSARVQVSFHFAIQPNETNIKIGNTTFDKKGWQYFWAIVDATASGTTDPTASIKGAFVADVCESTDFSVFGL